MNFCIEASNSNPATCQGYEPDNLHDYQVTTSRSEAASYAKQFLARGYWVEIYNGDTKELFAGPFDPDRPEPSYIV
jgi:putative methionine-R-sulfoxide reductase with GAF domain